MRIKKYVIASFEVVGSTKRFPAYVLMYFHRVASLIDKVWPLLLAIFLTELNDEKLQSRTNAVTMLENIFPYKPLY